MEAGFWGHHTCPTTLTDDSKIKQANRDGKSLWDLKVTKRLEIRQKSSHSILSSLYQRTGFRVAVILLASPGAFYANSQVR